MENITQSDIALKLSILIPKEEDLKLSDLKTKEDLQWEFNDLLNSDPDFHYDAWEFDAWVEDHFDAYYN